MYRICRFSAEQLLLDVGAADVVRLGSEEALSEEARHVGFSDVVLLTCMLCLLIYMLKGMSCSA
jgi:hypothetical protein